MKILIVLVLLLVGTALLGYGQSPCPKDKVYGAWKSITNRPGIISSIDSLKRTVIHANYTTLAFQPEGTYTFTHQGKYDRKPRISKGNYTFHEQTCEIILGIKRKASQNANLELLYIDDQYLICASDNNPKGYYTYLFSRE